MADAALKNGKLTRVLELFKAQEHFCKTMLDAYAVIDTTGKVVKSNQMFSQLVGKKSRQILKADAITDLLSFDVNDKQITVKELFEISGPTRMDEVRGVSELRDDLNLILGLYPFFDGDEIEGVFLLIRDVTAETALQDKYKVKATQSITDPLTGLYNRGYFEQYLPVTIEKIETSPMDSAQRAISVIMTDIDHFKNVNDTYGHQAGDHVIAKVSTLMLEKLRKTDVICRYGGEEFLGILPSTDTKGAFKAAENIRVAVEEAVFIHDGNTIPITISIGVSQVMIGSETGEQAIARADSALYKAKQTGRNKVCVHPGKEDGSKT